MPINAIYRRMEMPMLVNNASEEHDVVAVTDATIFVSSQMSTPVVETPP